MASLAITHFDIDANYAGSRLLPYQSLICRESRKLHIIRPLINNQLDHAGSPAYPSQRPRNVGFLYLLVHIS